MRKKLFTFLLALVTSVGLSYAQNPSGSCGENLSWEFNPATGTLTITGSGAMTDWASTTSRPWHSYQSDITSLSLPEGLTFIGRSAFQECQMTSVELPNSLEEIGRAAFCACGLTSVTIPDNVQTIGQSAFASCQNLSTITIGSGVTSIGYFAFSNLMIEPWPSRKLESVTCYATTPPTCGYDESFSELWDKEQVPLYVPAESVDAYKAKEDWKDFDVQAISGGSTPTPTPSGDKLPGVFSVSGTKAVNFSKGNLQYDSDNQIWQFAANQWDYIGNAAGNNAITADGIADNNGIVDMFCWVGASSSLEGIKQYGIINAWSSSSYGSVAGEALKSDWGNIMGGDWRTLSKDEWIYLLTERTNAANLRTLGTVNGKAGLILMPDGWTASGVALTVTTANYTTNDINTTNWATLEGQGCAFLPAAGCCTSGFFDGVGGDGSYWSSTSRASGATYAHRLHFRATDVDPTDYVQRYNGMSVRLVSEASPAPTPTPTPNSIVINGTPAVGDNSISLTYYFDPANVPGICCNAPTLKVKCAADNKWDEKWLSLSEISSGTTTITLNELGSFQAGKSYDVCFAYNNGGWVDDVFQSFTPAAPTPTTEDVNTNPDPENPSYHYSTFFHSTQNYKLSNDGTQAFIADLSNNELVLTEIAHGEQVIPANTAVILRKTGSADPVVLVPTAENGVSVNPDDNSLEGVDVATPVTDIAGLTTTNCYVLSGTAQYGVGFYRINGNTLIAHKAYVKYAGSSNNAPKKMRFVYSQATGIEDVQGNNVQSTKVIENGVLYIIRDGKTYNAMGQIVK